MDRLLLPLCSVLAVTLVTSDRWSDLGLPDEHLPYYFTSHPTEAQACEQDPQCPYKTAIGSGRCWGHEDECPQDNRMLSPLCPQQSSTSWARTKEEQMEKFWTQSDFGYLKERKGELKTICKGEDLGDSNLDCVAHSRYCVAKNLYMDLRQAKFDTSRDRYREDLFTAGQIGGHCNLDREQLRSLGEHKSPLQSWYAELQNFSSLDFRPSDDKHCDVTLVKPTILMKLDAGVNMYHHFCDYVNLYLSQHLNNSFEMDVNIIMWDTSGLSYGDYFSVTWQAFSTHPVTALKHYEGKRVCIKDAMFPLLPRMRYGLYYNMPLIPGCYGSSVFRAFSQHVLHRLTIPQEGPLEDKIRVTLLSRRSTYRNIINEDEVVKALKTVGEYDVRVVVYDKKMSFTEQLQSSYNSDVFMGMHGAGLTHLLFQPDWGAFFEIYNCGDRGCYSDLARLRGVLYLTWENMDMLEQEDEGHHPTLGAHLKFTNYAFDVGEFMRMVAKAADHVRNHPRFLEARQKKYGVSPSSIPRTPKEEL